MERIEITSTLVLFSILTSLTYCCYPGMASIGTVSPLGDIIAKVGSDIIINCTLKDDYDGPANASDIRWSRNSTEIPSDVIVILNNQTAQLKLINTTMEDSGYYSCYANTSGVNTTGVRATICNNDVKIGNPPPDNVNITCLSRNWKNLTCTWLPPYNPVHTKWSFFYRLYRYRLECPEYINGRTGCFFSEQTKPPYRQAAKEYFFALEGENPLGKNWVHYVFSHYEHVLPNPPSELVALEVDSRQLQIKWNSPFGMRLFPSSLDYQLEYCSRWDPNWKVEHVGLNTTSIILSNLIPNTNYTFKVQCRSGASPLSPWSSSSFTWKKTPLDVPGAAPNISSSSYQQKNTLNKRDVYLHWQAIPKILENGNNVSYVIDALEDGLQRTVTVQELSHTSALIKNLELQGTYIFRLRARNEKGISTRTSHLTLLPARLIPSTPDYLNVVAFEDGVYEISWILGDALDIRDVDNFTLFWCETLNIHPGHRCFDSNIFWTTLGKNLSTANLTLSKDMNYQFALSVNVLQVSSGMMWASCIVPYNGVVGKMKSVSVVQIRIHEIELSWRLDCSEKSGIMIGFNIYYCVYDKKNERCLDNETHQEYDPNPFSDRFTLHNLKPNTYYKIKVSAVTKAGEGEQSDHIINATLEGAPDDYPLLGLSLVSNSTIKVAVQKPHFANGIIRKYKFYINTKNWENVTDKSHREFILNNLNSYTNYSVQVAACTVGELCSPKSPALLVTTGIGIPSPPAITEIKSINVSHVKFEWDDPITPNGPILNWVIEMSWKDGKSQQINQKDITFIEDGSRVRFIHLPIRCADSNDLHPKDPEYTMNIRALTTMLEGQRSKTVTVKPCSLRGSEVVPVWLVVVICACAVLLLCCLFLCRALRRLKKKVQEMQNIKVQLPKGLDSPNITSLANYGDYEPAFMSPGRPRVRGIHGLPTGIRLPESEFRNARCHSNPRHSTSSIDELLHTFDTNRSNTKRMACRLHSHDSSGCSSGQGSISSSVTGRTHMSSDSGAETDPLPPLTPESEFKSPIWKPIPITKDELDRLPAVHYSKLAQNGAVVPVLESGRFNPMRRSSFNDDYSSSDDYLDPIVPQHLLTIGHMSALLNKPLSLPEPIFAESPPFVPSKSNKLYRDVNSENSSFTKNKTDANISSAGKNQESEAGYAKLGFSQSALEKERNKQTKNACESQRKAAVEPSCSSGISDKTFIVSPIASRTMQLHQTLRDRENIGERKEMDNDCGKGLPLKSENYCRSDTTSIPFPKTGNEKNPYVTMDDMRSPSSATDRGSANATDKLLKQKTTLDTSAAKTYLRIGEPHSDVVNSLPPTPSPLPPVLTSRCVKSIVPLN